MKVYQNSEHERDYGTHNEDSPREHPNDPDDGPDCE